MVANRSDAKASDAEIARGIPLFFNQIIETLRLEQADEASQSRAVSGIAGGGTTSEIGDTATLHGRDLLKQGYTLEQVVRDYGDVCQAVTNLAYELDARIEVDEFRTLNRCIDNAIAGAVTEFAHRQKAATEDKDAQAFNSRLGFLAHELRNHLHTAKLAMAALKGGSVGIAGATGAVLDRSLARMQSLIDRSLTEVRVAAALPPRLKPVKLAELLGEAEAAAALNSHARGCQLCVAPIDPKLAVYADPEMLSTALSNLLQNAFKFTQPATQVRLHAQRIAERIVIEIEDHCGGLPAGAADTLLKPFVQRGEDRSGLGLGLDICRRSVEANNGTLSVRDVPGSGCIFTIDLPRLSLP